MNNRIEKKIQRMLMVGKTSAEVFDELTAYLFQKKITDDEKISIVKFARNAGLDKQLMSVFVDLFHERHVISWNLFMDLVHKHKIDPPKKVIESVFKGVKKQARETDLSLTQSWDHLDSRFRETRESILGKLKQEHSLKKGQMLEKLNFYRFQRMFHEEEKLLKIMVRMFPGDPEIQKELERFKETQAHEIISRSGTRDFERVLVAQSQKLSKGETKFLHSLKSFVIESIKKNKGSAYNFIIMFKLMGQPRPALELIPYAPKTQSMAWLEIDLLLEAGKNVECLDKIHEIEIRFSQDPETTFAATYARAKALHNLGQGAKAIDLLRSILDIRPDYRSANSLLTEWAQQWI